MSSPWRPSWLSHGPAQPTLLQRLTQERTTGHAQMTSVVAAAPAKDHCSPADRSASLPNAGWLTVHARRHQREVCSLSGRVMSQPLSGPLPTGLRLLPRPLPAAPSTRLAARFPRREDYGLTTLRHGNLRGLGPASTPVARHLRRGSSEPRDLATYLFGPSLSAPWACSCVTALTAVHLG